MIYDSRPETLAHIERVNDLLCDCAFNLEGRGAVHDASKLQEPEKSGFDLHMPMLRSLTYGSDGYRAALDAMGVTLRHHYENNPHHPEYYPVPKSAEIEKLKKRIARVEELAPRSRKLDQMKRELSVLESRVNNMSLFDIIEMLVDWKAASERHDDGDFWKSLEHNRGRFGISDQLYSIFVNTAIELGFIKNDCTE